MFVSHWNNDEGPSLRFGGLLAACELRATYPPTHLTPHSPSVTSSPARMPVPTVADITRLVKNITQLSNALPPSILKATTKDKIWTVMHGDEGATPFETFNQRFDVLFAEDCRDSTGRMLYIRRGKSGMGAVCAYLKKLNWANGFPLDLIDNKLQRLNKELTDIMCVILISHKPGFNNIQPVMPTSTSQKRLVRSIQHKSSETQIMPINRSLLISGRQYRTFSRLSFLILPSQTSLLLSPHHLSPHPLLYLFLHPSRPFLHPSVLAIPAAKDRSLPLLTMTTTTTTARMEMSSLSQVTAHEIVVHCLLIANTTAKRKRPTLGNPDDRDDEGFLMDVDVQSIDDDTAPSREEKRRDVDEFFQPAITKEVNGKSKKYRTCKICS